MLIDILILVANLVVFGLVIFIMFQTGKKSENNRSNNKIKIIRITVVILLIILLANAVCQVLGLW
jgi:putative copper export protein